MIHTETTSLYTTLKMNEGNTEIERNCMVLS